MNSLVLGPGRLTFLAQLQRNGRMLDVAKSLAGSTSWLSIENSMVLANWRGDVFPLGADGRL